MEFFRDFLAKDSGGVVVRCFVKVVCLVGVDVAILFKCRSGVDGFLEEVFVVVTASGVGVGFANLGDRL